MAKFQVTAFRTVSTFYSKEMEFEAETEEQAIEMASEYAHEEELEIDWQENDTQFEITIN